jgi:hypothetical protein
MQMPRILYAIILTSVLTNPAYAFEADKVHPDINESATQQSNLDQYLGDVGCN